MKRLDFARVTTRGGDKGETSLFSGERLRKDDPLFECLGGLDEASSLLGLCRAVVRRDCEALPAAGLIEDGLLSAQQVLQRIMAQVATDPQSDRYDRLRPASQSDLESLEAAEIRLMRETAIAPGFVIPGSTVAEAQMDVARAVTRRAERSLVAVVRDRARPDLHDAQRFVNRLSDYLFVAARCVAGGSDG